MNIHIEIEEMTTGEIKTDLARIFGICLDTRDLNVIATWIEQSCDHITVYRGGNHLAIHGPNMKPPRLVIITIN